MSNLNFEIDPLHYLIALVSFMFGFYKMFIKPKADKRKEEWLKITNYIDRIPQIADTVIKIQQEVFANGGGSLRDSVDRIEKRIVTVEEKQNIYLKDARHGVFETDPSGRWIEVNRTLCRMVMCTENELIGKGWMNFFDQETINRINHAMANEIEVKIIGHMKTTDDKTMIVSVIANPLRSSLNKSLIGYLGTIDEII
jgi:PAS domain S-box-containing protein